MVQARLDKERSVLKVCGTDRLKFLQDMVTNDLDHLADGLVYAGLLTPQGKYLFDFFVIGAQDAILIDVDSTRASVLAARLGMYKLRADVVIKATDLVVVQVWGDAPAGGLPDPRHPDLGLRFYTDAPEKLLDGATPMTDAAWTALRVGLAIPQTGVELIPDETFPLEAGFERLSGVDFRKGCYVGQEVTARMKHKTSLKKGLVRVVVEGPPPAPGTEIRAGEKVAGTLYSVAEGYGLAQLRFDRATDDMTAGGARVVYQA